MWKQITEFDKKAYKNELMVCLVWLGLGEPIVVTCKYNKKTDLFNVVKLVRTEDNGVSLSAQLISYTSQDIRCWAWLNDLAVDTKEFKKA